MLSNFESLSLRPATRSTDKRISRLEQTCKQLRQYRARVKGSKRIMVYRLISKYESLLDRIMSRV